MGKPERNSKHERLKLTPRKPEYKGQRDAARQARELAERRAAIRARIDEDEL